MDKKSPTPEPRRHWPRRATAPRAANPPLPPASLPADALSMVRKWSPAARAMAPPALAVLQSEFRARTSSVPVYSLYSCLPYFVFSFAPLYDATPFGRPLFNKKPAIDWQSRVSENLFSLLESPPHDAFGAMPDGHLSIHTLPAQANC